MLCRNCNGIEGRIKNLVTRARRTSAHEEYLVRLAEYWRIHSTPQTKFLYPSHKTDEQKAEIRKIKAKKAYAKRKVSKK